MAQQIINIGTTPNDGTGDKHRDAFNKINQNFTDLYDDGGANIVVIDPTTSNPETLNDALANILSGGGSGDYVSYVALMNYSSPADSTVLSATATGANCIKVLNNALGGAITITKTSTGAISITNAGSLFTPNKTTLEPLALNSSLGYNFDISAGVINILMMDIVSNTPSNGLAAMTDVKIEIRVYN